MDTYTDEYGYRRFRDSDKLVHRWVAYKYLYDPDHYSYPFSYYQIHHIDSNKMNNHMDNLEILTPDEHMLVHGIFEPENTTYEYCGDSSGEHVFDPLWLSVYDFMADTLVYGAIFWILTIPITGAIGLLFAIICAVLHWWKKNSE